MIMIKKTLFHELTGLDPQVMGLKPSPVTPESISYTLLFSGYLMEYFRVGPNGKKVVALFWGPQEHVVPSHRGLSKFHSLKDGTYKKVTHEEMLHCLRRYGGVREVYWQMRELYRNKVADRIYMAQHMTPAERYAHVEATQPWVFELAEKEDIASYLRVDVGELEGLRRLLQPTAGISHDL
jgi:hypothetical protein